MPGQGPSNSGIWAQELADLNGIVNAYEYHNIPVPNRIYKEKEITETKITFKVPHTPNYQFIPLRINKDWSLRDGSMLPMNRFFLFVPPIQNGQDLNAIKDP